MTANPERRRRRVHWYDRTNVPRGGDAGEYYLIHSDIDRLRYRLSEFQLPSERTFLIPEIEVKLNKLTGFLKSYGMDVDRDMDLTLAEINPWLKGHEIQRDKKKR